MGDNFIPAGQKPKPYVNMVMFDLFKRAYGRTARERGEMAEAGIKLEEMEGRFQLEPYESAMARWADSFRDPRYSEKTRDFLRKNFDDRYVGTIRLEDLLAREGDVAKTILDHPTEIMLADIARYVSSQGGSCEFAKDGSPLFTEIVDAAEKVELNEKFRPPGMGDSFPFKTENIWVVQKTIPVARLQADRDNMFFLAEGFQAYESTVRNPAGKGVFHHKERIAEGIIIKSDCSEFHGTSHHVYHKTVPGFLYPAGGGNLDK
jgi:hypothetical protein